jgi:acetolactate synthase-1/2/3 large subunit
VKVTEYIVNELIRLGVEYVFTLPGGFSMYLNDAIGHSALKPVYMLHESGAAFAAAGYAQYSGKVGVCVVTSGLAQTNALSGVASAYSDHLPMMVISGDVRTEFILKRDREHLRQGGQQDVKIARIAQAVTKGAMVMTDPHSIKNWFSFYWKLAHEAAPGPVWLDIPIDIQQEEIE